MADEFKGGDIVQLKSGGPPMTVLRAGDMYGTKLVWCSWFDGATEKTGKFPPAALKIMPDTQKP
jgi:uncharacterized protein YodC (DUF2158 family)